MKGNLPSWLIAIGIMTLMVLSGCSADTTKESDTTKEPEEKAIQLEEKPEAEKNTTEADEKPVTEAQEAQSTEKTQEELAKSFGLELVTVGRVVDGDTIETSDGRKIRLVGVNTPESTTRTEIYGKEASNYTKSKLAGKQIWIQKDVSETDRYNRYLRIIWMDVPTNDLDETEIRTKMFNADLVLNGYAEPSTYPPDVKYSEYFVKFAREARKANKGLWSYGEQGTTKGDLDQKNNSGTAASGGTGTTGSSGGTSTNHGSTTEVFQNCTELRKVYPNGVPSTHPAYQAKMDRDKDNYACES
ncbi:thermonuclease family protein [Neobacillus niacini]|uniref:thermonuclease family protein n=1 Tax=Neobacillus niacini TaxID=86668 RepID=UPI0021CB10A6|nr:thermonuclease family protein [Neobacillus niacini]MCM3764722.1 thermonuclease family protein [Neobacillus niacini]